MPFSSRAAILLLLLTAACATPRAAPPPPAAPAPPAASARPASAATAASAGVSAVPGFAEMNGWAAANHEAGRAAFLRSCPALMRRADASGLTQAGDWAEACAEAAAAGDARAFFESSFVPLRVGDGRGLNTGYFEPEIAGSRVAAPGFPAPIYRKPPDLIEVDLSAFADTLKGKRIRGRVAGQTLVPYFDRGAIEDGALAGRGLELAWAADPYELFFLHIQGSGRIRLPDGAVLRVGYDGQNGHDYVGIGKLMRERGLLAPGKATMEDILAWLRAHPAEGRALMRENGSYIFFRELTGGAVGALGVEVTPEATVAADPAFVPLGAPLWLETTVFEGGSYRPLAQLWVAQDTGGAIKGANRLDLFWGAGARARAIAGSLSAQGITTLLLPKAAAARLLAHDPAAR